MTSNAQENILISDEGHALITDFGGSCINTASAATGVLPTLTLRFAAPELVLAQVKKATKQVDIWSLGCVFYTVSSPCFCKSDLL